MSDLPYNAKIQGDYNAMRHLPRLPSEQRLTDYEGGSAGCLHTISVARNASTRLERYLYLDEHENYIDEALADNLYNDGLGGTGWHCFNFYNKDRSADKGMMGMAMTIALASMLTRTSTRCPVVVSLLLKLLCPLIGIGESASGMLDVAWGDQRGLLFCHDTFHAWVASASWVQSLVCHRRSPRVCTSCPRPRGKDRSKLCVSRRGHWCAALPRAVLCNPLTIHRVM